jgi:uncharacterized protein (TIGR04255 family)
MSRRDIHHLNLEVLLHDCVSSPKHIPTTVLVDPMPDESFENAPLVEIVAELRWTPAELTVAVQQQVPAITFATSQPPSFDQLFGTFNGEVYQNGFRSLERLIPPGFPIVLHQPILRFRRDQPPAVFQLGMGLFSANGLQPYRSWTEFRPVVQLGVDALLKAHTPADRARPFSLLSLRYINAFGVDLLGGKTAAEFMTDTLGFSLKLPASIDALIDDPAAMKSHSQLVIPVKGGPKTMTLSIGEGASPIALGATALLMEMTIAEQSVEPDDAKIMAAFDSSRAIIHDTFVGMTQAIHPLMKPRKQS